MTENRHMEYGSYPSPRDRWRLGLGLRQSLLKTLK